MSLEKIPSVSFADCDVRRIEGSIISAFEAAAHAAGIEDYSLYPGDPRRLFLESVAALIVQQNNVIQRAGLNLLLKYAEDGYLENRGALYGKRGERLSGSAAVTTLRYELSIPVSWKTHIPLGSRVRAADNVVFATTEALEISAGDEYGEVAAECIEPGESGNGFAIGQIQSPIDVFPFIKKVYNISPSSGGSDIEDLEAYRQRLYSAPESFSVAGPDGAYAFWAASANPLISDVSVDSPNPGEVTVIPLLKGGEIPTQDILDSVYEVLNDRSVRPLTDLLRIEAPNPVLYKIDVDYYIDRADRASYIAIAEAVEIAVNEYIAWQCGKLGRDIEPSRLIDFLMCAGKESGIGIKRVELREPKRKVLNKSEIAQLDEMNLNYGGMEDA